MGDYPIIVAFDGSEQSRRALAWAVDEGLRRERSVCLIYVLEPDAWSSRPADQSHRDAAETAINRLVAETSDWGRLGIEISGLVLDGPVAPTLQAQSGHASMIVIGDRGHGGFAGLHLGSVPQAVATHARCPVLVVRNCFHAPDSRPIVVGVDDSPHAELGIGYAFDEAARREVGLLAVRALTGRQEENLVESILTPWRARFPKVAVTTRIVPVTAIHALTVASCDAQLLVTGCRASETGDINLGSISDQLLQYALSSVLVVHGPIQAMMDRLAPAARRNAQLIS